MIIYHQYSIRVGGEEVWKCNNAEKEIKLIIFTKSHTTHI